MTVDARQLADRVRQSLAPAGLDRVQAFDAAWYNARIAGHASLQPLHTFGRDSALALLVASTRALWPALLAALRADPVLRASADPVDDFSEACAVRALAELPVRHELHAERQHGPRVVSLLHAAEASGFAAISPAQLAVHAEHGPWFGLRAVIVFDVPAGLTRREPCSPCASCRKPCAPLFERAREAYVRAGQPSIASSWKQWVAVRDACPVGRAHRYSDEQIDYHYTKDRARLHAAAFRATTPGSSDPDPR